MMKKQVEISRQILHLKIEAKKVFKSHFLQPKTGRIFQF